VPERARAFAPVTLALAGLCLALAWAGEGAAAALAWHRGAIFDGQLWRLWTGHLVHCSPSHAGADVLVVAVAGLVAEPVLGARRLAATLAAGAAAISIGLLACVPALADYRGASGLAVLMMVLAGAVVWRQVPERRTAIGCAGLALAGKLAWEAAGGGALAALPAGVAVAWQAHWLGAAGGLAAARYAFAWAGHPVER
jgi:rhomboid family GlyGly-CTERM serine protease